MVWFRFSVGLRMKIGDILCMVKAMAMVRIMDVSVL